MFKVQYKNTNLVNLNWIKDLKQNFYHYFTTVIGLQTLHI